MNNLFVVSFMLLLAINIFLLIVVLCRSKTKADVIRIIGKAFVRGHTDNHGDENIYYSPSTKRLHLYGFMTKKDFVEKNMEIVSWINALADYMDVQIETQKSQPEKYIAVKKDKKA